MVPDSLYMLLRWILEGSKGSTALTLDREESTNDDTHHHILSIGQDMLHAVSHGEVHTPKHISLAMTVNHLTGSKQIVTLLNRLGHTISYDELQCIDTALAET
jgi:hypothetical protein